MWHEGDDLPNPAKELDMYDRPLPAGWRILSYGIDITTHNKYIKIVLPNGLVASCISGPRSYGGLDGLWEICPCWYFGGDQFTTMYSDEMHSVLGWSDVQGYLDTRGVNDILFEMSEVDPFRITTMRDAFMKIRSQQS